MSDPDDDGDDAVQQRTVSAADGSPLHTPAASSVFDWRGPGAAPAAEIEPSAAPPTEEPSPEKEETMANKRNGAASAVKSTRGSPQLQICSALMRDGDLAREAIAAAVPDLTTQQIASALNNAKQHGRIAWIEKDQVFRLTKAGQEWVNAAGSAALEADAPRAKGKRAKAARKGGHRRQRKAKVQEVDTSPPAGDGAEEPSFRCAVMSDGSFFLSKDEVAIELTPNEHRRMLAYLERMAVEA